MLRYEIDIETAAPLFRIDGRQCRAIISAVLGRLGYKEAGLSIKFITHQKMIAYNKKTFKKNQTTDVISFPWSSDSFDGMDFYLGDMIICVDQVYAQAQSFEVSCENELCRIMIHGLLHLIGHEDTTRAKKETMFLLQEELVTFCMAQGFVVRKLMSKKKKR